MLSRSTALVLIVLVVVFSILLTYAVLMYCIQLCVEGRIGTALTTCVVTTFAIACAGGASIVHIVHTSLREKKSRKMFMIDDIMRIVEMRRRSGTECNVRMNGTETGEYMMYTIHRIYRTGQER